MSEKIMKFISNKLRIFSLLFILTTLIITVNGGLGPSRISFQTCQSNVPTKNNADIARIFEQIQNRIQDRIKNLLHEDTGLPIDLPRTLKWDIKYCDPTTGEVTYSIIVPVTQGRLKKEFEYLAYVLRNRIIIDVRSMRKIDAEKKILNERKRKKFTNAADFSESMEKDIEDRILHILTRTLRTNVTRKQFAKTELKAYNEKKNQIEYYVNYKDSNEKPSLSDQYIVYVRYNNGKQEITKIKSLFDISLGHV